jgi:AcrR family transcriptional regulator
MNVTALRPRARKGDGDRLREEILVAAERLLLETGSEEAVSIRAVAKAVGVTAPSIYRHFEDKTDLMFEVCARQFAAFDAALISAVEGIEDPEEAMYACGRAYVRFGMDHPEHYRIMFMLPDRATPEKWDDVMATGSFAVLTSRITQLTEQGLLRDGTDSFELALHVWSNIHGLTSLLVARPTLPWPELDTFIDDHLAMCLGGAIAPRHQRRKAGRRR